MYLLMFIVYFYTRAFLLIVCITIVNELPDFDNTRAFLDSGSTYRAW